MWNYNRNVIIVAQDLRLSFVFRIIIFFLLQLEKGFSKSWNFLNFQGIFKTSSRRRHLGRQNIVTLKASLRSLPDLKNKLLILITSVLVMRHNFNIFKKNRIVKEIIQWFILSDKNKWLANTIKTLAWQNSETKFHLEDQILHRCLLLWEALSEKNWTQDRDP